MLQFPGLHFLVANNCCRRSWWALLTDEAKKHQNKDGYSYRSVRRPYFGTAAPGPTLALMRSSFQRCVTLPV